MAQSNRQGSFVTVVVVSLQVGAGLLGVDYKIKSRENRYTTVKLMIWLLPGKRKLFLQNYLTGLVSELEDFFLPVDIRGFE